MRSAPRKVLIAFAVLQAFIACPSALAQAPPSTPVPVTTPPGQARQPLPPWLAKFGGKVALKWTFGHAGYDRHELKGIWHASERAPWDRGLFMAFGPNDEWSFGLNMLIMINFNNVNNGSKEEGLSFGVPRSGFVLTGNMFSPNFSYMFTVLFSTSLGQSPFFVDAALIWSLIPGKLLVSAGQHRVEVVPQEATLFGNFQLIDRSLATRFFQINRSIGVRVAYAPLRALSFQAGVWNHTIEEVQTVNANPIAFNQYNPDARVMITAGADLDLGLPYGSREGDFIISPRPALKVSLRGYFADVDRQGPVGVLGKSGHILFGNAFIGLKYRGLGFSAGAFARWSQFVNLNPDLVDFGTYVQAGYFVVKRVLEISARYSQIWPDVFQPLGTCPGCLHDPRSLPPATSLAPVNQNPVNLYDPPFPVGAKIEIGGGLKIFPTRDQQHIIGIVYLWRDHDSQLILSVATWL